MIVVAIIGLLITIALPNYIKSRRTAQEALCVSNMRLLHDACLMADIEYDFSVGQITQIVGVIKEGGYVKGNPKCGLGTRNYTFYKVSDSEFRVVCPNRHDHSTEWQEKYFDGYSGPDSVRDGFFD